MSPEEESMRLVTYRADDGTARLGAIAADKIVDLAEASGGELPSEMVAFIEAGPSALAHAKALLDGRHPSGKLLSSSKLLAPIPRPRRNVFCLGLNYRAHAAEAQQFGAAQKDPEFPIFFTKPPSTVIGPDAAIQVNTDVTKEVDWEVEVTVVIGPGGTDIARGAAMNHVFGYTIANDVSARDLQFRHGGQWFKGKGLDTFCPLGPWIVTADEIPDPAGLEVVCRVNGVEKQHANTRDLIFDIPTTIASLSEGLTLEAGDLILTGTPAGVGFARKPPEFLHDGDVVECEVDRIGVLRNPVQARGAR
jgi:2-keto-4-pentenoate hydratase/2-oxohepta-3-ene-1,7-dioic acid hydratase in catechol pathway